MGKDRPQPANDVEVEDDDEDTLQITENPLRSPKQDEEKTPEKKSRRRSSTSGSRKPGEEDLSPEELRAKHAAAKAARVAAPKAAAPAPAPAPASPPKKRVGPPATFHRAASMDCDDTSLIKVVFPGKKMGISLTLVKRPAMTGGRSVRVGRVFPGSPAADVGVREGDCLVFCNGVTLAPPTTPDGFDALTKSLSGAKRPLSLHFVRLPEHSDVAPLRTCAMRDLFASGQTHFGLVPTPDGLRVELMTASADAAGLRVGDIVVALDGDGRYATSSRAEFSKAARALSMGAPGRAPSSSARLRDYWAAAAARKNVDITVVGASFVRTLRDHATLAHANANGLDAAGRAPPLVGSAEARRLADGDDELDAEHVRSTSVGGALIVEDVETGEGIAMGGLAALQSGVKVTQTDKAVAKFLSKKKKQVSALDERGADTRVALDKTTLVAIATFKRVLIAGLPVSIHGTRGSRAEISLRPTAKFDGVRWVSHGLDRGGSILFKDIKSVDAAHGAGKKISAKLRANCRPAELSRSLTVVAADGAAYDLTSPSLEYFKLLSNGLNGVIRRPDKLTSSASAKNSLFSVILDEAKKEEEEERRNRWNPLHYARNLRDYAVDYATDARLHALEWHGDETARRTRMVRKANKRRREHVDDMHRNRGGGRLEHLHAFVHLYDDKHLPHSKHFHKFPLEEHTFCEILWHEGMAVGARDGVDEAEVDDFRAAFTEGSYCRVTVVAYEKDHSIEAIQHGDDQAHGTYTLKYEAGPFDVDDADMMGEESEAALVRDEILFKNVKREHIIVDYRDIPAATTPKFIVGLCILQMCLFFYFARDAELPISMSEPVAGPEKWWFRIIEPLGSHDPCGDVRHEMWSRLVTYSLVHRGMQHVLFNSLLMCIFGIPMEMVHGSGHMLVVFYLGVVMGGMFAGVWDAYGTLVGASGGAYCLMGVHMGNLVLNWNRMHRGMIKNYHRLVVYIGLLGIDVLQWYARTSSHSHAESSSSYAAHLGGYFGGFLLPFCVFKDIDSENWFHHAVLKPAAIVVSLLLWLNGPIFLYFQSWPPRSQHVKPPCCEQIIACNGLNADYLDDFSCFGDWKVHWQGFSDTHNSGVTATCWEMRKYQTSRGH